MTNPQPGRTQNIVIEDTRALYDLSTKLIECEAMRDGARRRAVINKLRSEISQRIEGSEIPLVHTLHIVNTCKTFSGGLDELLIAVYEIEGNTINWQKVEEFVLPFARTGRVLPRKMAERNFEPDYSSDADNSENRVIVSVRNFLPGLRKRYLKHLIAEYGLFNEKGLGLINSFRLDLEQVFVELGVSPINPTRPNMDLIAAIKQERVENSSFTIWDLLRFSERQGRNGRHTALVIIGPPGSGKTTLLQHVTVVLAANRQNQYRSRAYLPMLLFLRNHAATIAGDKPTLGDLLEDYFERSQEYRNLKIPSGWFEWQLQHRPCMVMLDGLDEVADKEQRQKVSAWVEQQVRSYPGCRFIVTARPQGYKDAPLNERADVVEVLPFRSEQVRKFVHNWYLANEVVSSGGKKDAVIEHRASREANDLLQRLRAVPALSALTANPLLLTMIVMVHRFRGQLPGTRVALYAEICEVLLERWRQVKGVTDNLKAVQKRAALQPLAAYMMRAKIRDIETERAIQIITPPLKEAGVEDSKAIRNFLSDIQAGSGLLLEREAGKWSFAHLTFQEYLTATYLKELFPSLPKEQWINPVKDSWWHETVLLYAAQVPNATPVVEACLEDGGIRALTLAAACLDEASGIKEEVRRQLEKRLERDLESPIPERRKLAAEVKLAVRLRRLQRMDGKSDIDPGYISCAEYQLFLDDMRAQGNYYHPQHWLDFSFPPEQAQKAVRGVSAEHAIAFCEWLTQTQGGEFVYRLPKAFEVNEHPGNNLTSEIIGDWYERENGEIGLARQSEIEQEFRRKVSLPGLPQPSFSLILKPTVIEAVKLAQRSAPEITLTPALAKVIGRNRDFARARGYDPANDLAFTLFDVLGPDLNITDFGLGNALVSALDRALDLTSGYKRSEVEDAITRNDFAGARRYSQELQKSENENDVRLGTLWIELLNAIMARYPVDPIKARLRYIARIVEYSYIGFSKMSGYGSQANAVIELFWRLQILLMRAEGKLSAWEGIRIVRERKK